MKNLLILPLFSILLISCFSYSKNINKNGKNLPPDIGKVKTILLMVLENHLKTTSE